MCPKPTAQLASTARKVVSEVGSIDTSLETDFRQHQGLALGCLNAAIDEANAKREALARSSGMSPGQFSKVTNNDLQRQGLHCVLDALPQDIFVDFMVRFGHARGLKVREIETAELTDEFLAAVDRMLTLGKLLRVRRPRPLKVGL